MQPKFDRAQPKALVPDTFRKTQILVVAAHPDDEVIGAGAQLPEWPKTRVLYVTDGAPCNLQDARRAGFSSCRSYGKTRLAEAQRAMALAGISASQIECLGFVDQGTSLSLKLLTLCLREHLLQLRPELILTHPYEGGHPDHDATAFAVHSARGLLEREGCRLPELIEMTSYHNQAGCMATAHFLPSAGHSVTTFPLTPEQQDLKKKLFECFATQREVLRYFPIECERFRPAPIYDFSQPPHRGTLYYELFDWGMTGTRWCELAEKVSQDLALPLPLVSQITSVREGV